MEVATVLHRKTKSNAHNNLNRVLPFLNRNGILNNKIGDAREEKSMLENVNIYCLLLKIFCLAENNFPISWESQWNKQKKSFRNRAIVWHLLPIVWCQEIIQNGNNSDLKEKLAGITHYGMVFIDFILIIPWPPVRLFHPHPHHI